MMGKIVHFATGEFPYSSENQSFWMAIQGSMAVRTGINSKGNLHWFHAFTLSVLTGFAGGWLGFVWMGKPSSMLSNDLNMGSCILAFILVNYTPFDIGFKLCQTVPVTLITTSFAQLFRSVAIMKFVNVCFDAFKDNPSPYYPIPVFGPILYATLLGNMAGFLLKGIEGHVGSGMPWNIQNGLFVASFYHFFMNDTKGPIGSFLRQTFVPLKASLGLDDRSFAACVVSYFMQIMGFLQLPMFLGPQFSPFTHPLLSYKTATTTTASPAAAAAAAAVVNKVERAESGGLELTQAFTAYARASEKQEPKPKETKTYKQVVVKELEPSSTMADESAEAAEQEPDQVIQQPESNGHSSSKRKRKKNKNKVKTS